MWGRLHIKTTQILPYFCCIPLFQSFLSLYIPLSFANFSHLTKKKICRSADHRCIFICIYFSWIFVCIKGHPSSDSGPSEENFIYPTILCKLSTLNEKKICRSADHRCIFICIYFSWIFVCIKGHPSSDSGPSEENFMKRVQIQDDEEAKERERGNKKLCEQAVCELSSSQEFSSTQSAKEILRRRIEQRRLQQNGERFSRSQGNASLSNWALILSNLGYFCEVRSIIAACNKILGAYCRFDHWTVKSQVYLH